MHMGERYARAGWVLRGSGSMVRWSRGPVTESPGAAVQRCLATD